MILFNPKMNKNLKHQMKKIYQLIYLILIILQLKKQNLKHIQKII